MLFLSCRRTPEFIFSSPPTLFLYFDWQYFIFFYDSFGIMYNGIGIRTEQTWLRVITEKQHDDDDDDVDDDKKAAAHDITNDIAANRKCFWLTHTHGNQRFASFILYIIYMECSLLFGVTLKYNEEYFHALVCRCSALISQINDFFFIFFLLSFRVVLFPTHRHAVIMVVH